MPISSNLVTATQTRIDAVTSSCCANDFALAATAATEMSCYDSNRKVSVATVNDLPNIDTCNIGPGHIVFVESINVPVMSYEQGWMGLDRRVLRKDVPERRLWVWGYNGLGQLGTGNITTYISPVTTAGGGTNWCQVAGGASHSGGIKTDGTLWMWGCNLDGQLGTGNVTIYISPVTTAGGGTTWCQVSANMNLHTAAIKTDGTLWVWGRNALGQLGTGNTTYYSSPVTTVAGGANWRRVYAGLCNTGAIKTDGTLWVWGYNTIGQLGTGNTTSYSSPVTTAGGGTNWCSIAGGKSNHFGIKTDGTLWAWGNNNCGQLGVGDLTTYSSPVTVAGGGTNWCQVTAHNCHMSAIKTDGTLWSSGWNLWYQLGTVNTTTQSSPVTTAGGGTNWCQVSAGGCYSLAIKTDGTLWGWGANTCGQVGNGLTGAVSSPVSTPYNTSWCQVSATCISSLAITATY